MSDSPLPPGPPESAVERLAALRAAVDNARPGGFLLVLTHRTPDPDAMGAAVGIERLLTEGCGREVRVATTGRVLRAENVAMIEELGLDFADADTLDLTDCSGVLLVDTQPSFGHTTVPEGPPLLVVIDHHEPPTAAAGAEPAPTPAHVDIRVGVGATSSMVYEYLVVAGIELDQRTAGALFCGVRFDTGDLAEGVTDLDQRAWFHCFRRADQAALRRIQQPSLPAEYFAQLASALRGARRHGDMVLALLGEVVNQEAVAEMADLFLRLEGCRWTLVGGAVGGNYVVSLRTAHKGGGAYALLARVLEGRGSFGGHGRIAGGRVELADPHDVALRELERELSERVLALVARGADGDEPDSELRLGCPLA